MKQKQFINSEFKKRILNLVNSTLPRIRMCKYSYSYYLDKFILVLTKLSGWDSLSFVCNNDKLFHYKSIYNEFIRWTNNQIFVNSYIFLLNNYYFKLKDIKKSKTINLFIDSTFIINKYGIESIAKMYEYKKKKATKLSIISDQFKNVIGYHVADKSSIHDIKLVTNTIDNITLNLDNIKNINLIGDKGYISQNKYSIGKKELKIITPNKKYKKKTKKNTKSEHNLLKKRYLVEHAISVIKRTDRLMIRKDRINKTFISFINLKFIMMLSVKIDNNIN